MGTGTLSSKVKLPGREADQLLPTSAEIKKSFDLYIHSPSDCLLFQYHEGRMEFTIVSILQDSTASQS
jgi:hypothetical protein